MSVIRSVAHPGFTGAYRTLWQEFGASGELEAKAVLARRLRWRLEQPEAGWRLRYELVTVSDRSGGFAALRDHSVIIPPVEVVGNAPMAVVHLSHALVAPEWRRSGLAGWMRALPLQMARDCLFAAYGTDKKAALVLVAEMEPPDVRTAGKSPRLLAYEKAGFRAIDPAEVRYFQPDFAPPEIIAARGRTVPLPLNLVVRRVGREQETSMGGWEVRLLVSALYKMYAAGGRTEEIGVLEAGMEATYPRSGKSVGLIPPTQAHGSSGFDVASCPT